MTTQTLSVKRFFMGGLTAAALILPLALTTGAAQASRGSMDVRGNPNEQTMQVTGETPRVQPVLYSSHVTTPPKDLSLAQRAINPVYNPNKPLNHNP